MPRVAVDKPEQAQQEKQNRERYKHDNEQRPSLWPRIVAYSLACMPHESILPAERIGCAAQRARIAGVVSLKATQKQPQVLRLRLAQKDAPNSAQDDSVLIQ